MPIVIAEPNVVSLQGLVSQTHWVNLDGTQTVWNFSFVGGYLYPAHVKAYYIDAGGARHEVPLTVDSLTGPSQLTITPPIPAGTLRFVIYRETPRFSLVDFASGARITEANLDTIARQSMLVAGELLDANAWRGPTLTSLDALSARVTALEAALP